MGRAFKRNNKFEGHTIIPVLEAFKAKHKIGQLVVVADSSYSLKRAKKDDYNGEKGINRLEKMIRKGKRSILNIK